MEERRKNRRIELESKLVIKGINGNDSSEIGIEVTDVSKTGVGFICQSTLNIDTIYEAYLTIWTKEVLHAFLNIVRIEKVGDGKFEYGAVFIGMPEMDAARIGVYDTIDEMENS